MKFRFLLLSVFLSGLLIMNMLPFAHQMKTTVQYEPLSVQQMARFHGHLGPFVVLGARMGEDAVLQQNIPPYFGLQVTVECPETPPHSCLIDGIQISTGATMGKRNISHVPADKIRVTIQNEETGKMVIYTLKPSILKQLRAWELKNTDVEERGRVIFDMKAEELFNIEVIPENTTESNKTTD
jgi:formylmethanofuran dehydrogenase subunit E